MAAFQEPGVGCVKQEDSASAWGYGELTWWLKPGGALFGSVYARPSKEEA